MRQFKPSDFWGLKSETLKPAKLFLGNLHTCLAITFGASASTLNVMMAHPQLKQFSNDQQQEGLLLKLCQILPPLSCRDSSGGGVKG